MQDDLNLSEPKPNPPPPPSHLLAGVHVISKEGRLPLRMWVDFAEVRSFVGTTDEYKSYNLRFILRNKRECMCPLENPREAWQIIRRFQRWLRWNRCIDGVPDGRAGADDLAGVYFGSDRLDKEHTWIDFEDVRSINYVWPPFVEPERQVTLRFVLRDDLELGCKASVKGADAVLKRFDRWVLAKPPLAAIPTELPRPKSLDSEGLTSIAYDDTPYAVQRKKLKVKK